MSKTSAAQENMISERRLLWLTGIIMALMVGGSLFLANRSITLGLIFGGLLSFLNFYWLKKGVEKVFFKIAEGNRPLTIITLYIFRYGFMALVIALIAAFNLASVAATLIGLLSFAFAVLFEAIIQFYKVIFYREGN